MLFHPPVGRATHQAVVKLSKRTLTASSTNAAALALLSSHRIHLLFGANTDVGKSIVSTGLVRAAALDAVSSSNDSQHRPLVNYIKPLQCGGSDESFVLRHRDGQTDDNSIHCQTLFSWETPASPHLASRWENLPVSDEQVVSALTSSLNDITVGMDVERGMATTIVETAGGALSPSSSSPRNPSSIQSTNSKGAAHWGWSTQADLYSPLKLPVVFVGDGKLGGISVTLSSLEALWNRGYQVDAVVFIDGESERSSDETEIIQFGKGNAEALREYISMQQQQQHRMEHDNEETIIYLPALPPMPIPLDDWYESNDEAFMNLHRLLCRKWLKRDLENVLGNW